MSRVWTKIPFFYKPKYSIKKVYNSKFLKKEFKKCAIVAHFDPGGLFDPVFIHYLRSLKELGFDIYVCSTSLFLIKEEIDKCLNFAVKIYHRKNKGLDFASWAAVIEKEQVFENYQEMLLTNDSIIGPFELAPLKNIINSFADKKGLCGLINSYEKGVHIQSYFIYFNKFVMDSSNIKLFFKDVKILDDKQEIIRCYEIGLSELAHKECGQLYPYIDSRALTNKNINLSIVRALELIENYEFPFIKRMLLVNDSLEKYRCEKIQNLSFLMSEDLKNNIAKYLKRYKKCL